MPISPHYKPLSTVDEEAKTATIAQNLHRDEDLEMGVISAPLTRRSSTKSNLTEAQERELARLGLICSDEEMTQLAERQWRGQESSAGSILTQRRRPTENR